MYKFNMSTTIHQIHFIIDIVSMTQNIGSPIAGSVMTLEVRKRQPNFKAQPHFSYKLYLQQYIFV